MERPSFHQIYMGLAEALSQRSTCARMKVGCVIASIDFRKILAVGYNGGVTKGVNNCDRFGEEAVGNCGCLHAEENAVINCDSPREREKIVFCTHLPCLMCAKRLINMGGVKEIYYRNDYRKRDSLLLLHEHNVLIGHLTAGVTAHSSLQAAMLARHEWKEQQNEQR